jgi:hypothetical protein
LGVVDQTKIVSAASELARNAFGLWVRGLVRDRLAARARTCGFAFAFRHPSLIAGVMSRDFARRRDDAAVLVLRQSSAAFDSEWGGA